MPNKFQANIFHFKFETNSGLIKRRQISENVNETNCGYNVNAKLRSR